MITQVTISDDSRGIFSVLKPRFDGLAFQGLDVQGAVREVTDDIPDQDGQSDQTQFATTAAVSLTLRYYGQFRALMDEVEQYCVPWARPYLTVTDDEWAGPRILRLRYSTASKPLAISTGLTRTAQYQWKAPAGVWEDASATTYVIPGTASATEGLHVVSTTGLHVVAADGLHVVASAGTSDSLVSVGGNMRPPWTALLYGPCTGPALFNDTTGQALVFTDDLVLTAGQYVELDSAARSANFLSDPDESRLTYLNWSASDWFGLVPGSDALLRYAPDVVSAGAACALSFTNRRMA